MTYIIRKVLFLSMALICGDMNLVLFGLILISCVHLAYSQFPFVPGSYSNPGYYRNPSYGYSSPMNSNSNSNSGPGSNNPSQENSPQRDTSKSMQFYQRCETLIKKELAAMKETSLSKEVKLIGTASKLGGPIDFYAAASKVNQDPPLFSYTSRANPYFADEIIVMGILERTQKNDPLPLGWMSGAFIALRKQSDGGPSPFMVMLQYHAMVAYVRKDLNGTDIVEWDRFSQKIVRNLFHRASDVEVGESYTVETLLCAYGTCSCSFCKCGKVAGSTEKKSKGNKDTVKSPNPNTSKENPEKTTNESNENADGKQDGKSKKKRKNYGVAQAIAKSTKGNARSRSESHQQGAGSLAHSITEGNAAVAESVAHRGGSKSYAESKNDSLAESTGGKEGASSSSVTKKGAAQSSAQSRGGHVAAEATAIENESAEYNYYDGEPERESAEEFDGKNLVRDTNQKFTDANERAERMKSQASENLCYKEAHFEVNLTIAEQNILTGTDAFKEENQRITRDEVPMFLYRNPNRFGIDVEVGVNSSVLIATALPGFEVPRSSCCGLTTNSTSIIRKFLQAYGQDCNSDLETQVKRLERTFHNSYAKDLMNLKKLSLSQLRDLVPTILLTIHRDKEVKKGVKLVKKTFNTTDSENINKIVAVIVTGVHYAMTDGIAHKVKILKGLALNVRTVLTGVLLEVKRCKKDTRENAECSEKYEERLKIESKLILGLYYFLKFADSRYLYFKYRLSRPVDLYVDFMKTHEDYISNLVLCKSRRIVLNSA